MYDFHILTIGHLSRKTLCTSVLLRGYLNILVDPSLEPEEMEKLLYERTGLRQNNIDVVFVTHGHEDHFVGIEHFQRARWFISRSELEEMKQSADERLLALAKKFEPCGPNTATELIAGLDFTPLPGHTPGSTGILFNSPDHLGNKVRVCICGDAVKTRGHFNQSLGHINSVDSEEALSSIQRIAELADIVVPGHDNYFLTRSGQNIT